MRCKSPDVEQWAKQSELEIDFGAPMSDRADLGSFAPPSWTGHMHCEMQMQGAGTCRLQLSGAIFAARQSFSSNVWTGLWVDNQGQEYNAKPDAPCKYVRRSRPMQLDNVAKVMQPLTGVRKTVSGGSPALAKLLME